MKKKLAMTVSLASVLLLAAWTYADPRSVASWGVESGDPRAVASWGLWSDADDQPQLRMRQFYIRFQLLISNK